MVRPITVFIIDNCPNCFQVLSELEKWDLPFSEISLSAYPQKRKDLLQLCGKVSVPQLFIYEKHIGGVDETLALLTDFCSGICGVSSTPLLERIAQGIGCNVQTGRQNPRLMIPIMEADEGSDHEDDNEEDDEEEEDADEDENDIASVGPSSTANTTVTTATGPLNTSSRSGSSADPIRIPFPDGSFLTVLETTETLKQILPYGKRRWNFTTYKNCCTAEEIVDSLVQHYNLSRQEATAFGQLLNEQYHILHHVHGEHAFKDSPNHFFRLQCYQEPILNSYRVWPESSGRSGTTAASSSTDGPNAVMKRILHIFSRIEKAILGHDGILNYRIAFMCSDFPVFEDAICELQQVDISDLREGAMLVRTNHLYQKCRTTDMRYLPLWFLFLIYIMILLPFAPFALLLQRRHLA